MFAQLLTAARPSMRQKGVAILAGGFGGLMGTWFKFGWDAFWPPRASGRIPEPEVLISMFTHHPSSIGASHIFSFIFSVLSGIGYGVLVEFLPIASLGTGLVFGFAVWLGAHEVVMPWIGLTPPTWKIPANEQAAELFGHMLWGLVICVFYENFRGRWAKSSAAPIEAVIPQEVGAR